MVGMIIKENVPPTHPDAGAEVALMRALTARECPLMRQKTHPLFHAPPASPYRPACVVPRKSAKGNPTPFCLFVRRRVQSGKGAPCAPLSFLRLPVCMRIYVNGLLRMATGGTQKVRGSGLVRGAVAPHTRP